MLENKIFSLTMNPSIDKNSGVRQLEPNRKLRCQEPAFAPGGGGINVARAIHNLGGDVQTVYPGGGPTGDMLELLLNREEIPNLRIKTKNWTRGNFAVIEEVTNNQYRFEMPGAHLFDDEWKNCLKTILKEAQKADFLVASGSLPPGVPDDFYAQLARSTHGTRLKLIVDASGESLKRLEGSGVFLLKPDLQELREFTGCELLSEEDQVSAAREIVNNGTCDALVVSLGGDGAILVTRDFQHRFHSPAVLVKSRVGAGDSAVAGIVLGLTRNMDLKESVMFGIASGASAVMTPVNELCRRDETERIFNRMKECEP